MCNEENNIRLNSLSPYRKEKKNHFTLFSVINYIVLNFDNKSPTI